MTETKNDQPLQFWRVSPPRLYTAGTLAAQLEAEGWDGMTAGDSQSLAPDPYIVLTRAAEATSTIKLGTWVTNPVTRHAAVAAGALATLQLESGGRIEVGIGRGDSALAYIGLAPAPLGHFERYVCDLHGYLNGADVPVPTEPDGSSLKGLDEMEMGTKPTTSKLGWLPDEYTPVPVVVAASGPKVMQIAARTADKITAVVGPSPERLTWARDLILAAVDETRRPGAAPVLGTSCVVAVNENRELARQMVRPIVTVQARFAAMHDKVIGPASAELAKDLQALRRNYDMNRHASSGAKQSSVISDEVIDNFAIAGPASYVTERLIEIAELGYRRFTISVESPDVDQALVEQSQSLLGSLVLPKVRAALGQ